MAYSKQEEAVTVCFLPQKQSYQTAKDVKFLCHKSKDLEYHLNLECFISYKQARFLHGMFGCFRNQREIND